MRVNFVAWGMEKRSVPRICSIRFITEWTDHSMNEYLNHFVATCNARASAALGELILVILR